MFWRCAQCYRFNPESTRECRKCKGTRRLGLSDLQKVAQSVESSTGASLLVPIFQGSNARLKELAPEGPSGVCAVLASYYLRCQRQGFTAAERHSQFEKTAANFEGLAEKQRQYVKIASALATVHQATKAEENSDEPNVDAVDDLREKKLHFQYVLDKHRGGGVAGTEVYLGDISSCFTSLTGCLQYAGEFSIRLISDSARRGHRLAGRFGAADCELLDPNSGLWKCETPETLDKLFQAICTEFEYIKTYNLCEIHCYRAYSPTSRMRIRRNAIVDSEKPAGLDTPGVTVPEWIF
jgi:hypothetical protein